MGRNISDIQLVGLSDQAFEQATRVGRIKWAKNNTTCWEGLCNSARNFLYKYRRHVYNLANHNKVGRAFHCAITGTDILRLHRDFGKRAWYLDVTEEDNVKVVNMLIIDAEAAISTRELWPITEKYAEYLKHPPVDPNNPDAVACYKIRNKMKSGDMFFTYNVGTSVPAIVVPLFKGTVNLGPSDRGYRWVYAGDPKEQKKLAILEKLVKTLVSRGVVGHTPQSIGSYKLEEVVDLCIDKDILLTVSR